MNNIWTKEKCREEALKYSKISQLPVYVQKVIRCNKWDIELCSHMKTIHKPKVSKWTKEKCKEEALKFNSRYEFSLKSPTAYEHCYRNKWLDEVCTHMKKKGHRFKRLIYAYEFQDNSVYIGLTYNLENRDKIRKKNKKDSVTIHINKTGLIPTIKILTDYLHFSEASEKEKYYIQFYKENGWNMLNRFVGGGVGNFPKWSKDQCKTEALKYKRRSEWHSKHPNTYWSALKTHGKEFFKECVLHMNRRNEKYSDEDLYKVCQSIKSIGDLRKNYSKIYNALYNRGLYKEYTKHMYKLTTKNYG